jgi:HK97 gp10 family phage protein
VTDLDDFAERLERVASAGYPLEIVELLADQWVDTSQDEAPVDTAFMQQNIVVTDLSGGDTQADATVESRADYSGYVNNGTRCQEPRPFFDAGMISAEQLADQIGVDLGASIERLLDGGAKNPLRRRRLP